MKTAIFLLFLALLFPPLLSADNVTSNAAGPAVVPQVPAIPKEPPPGLVRNAKAPITVAVPNAPPVVTAPVPTPEKETVKAIDIKEKPVALKVKKKGRKVAKNTKAKEEIVEEEIIEETPPPRDELVEGLRAQIKALEDREIVNGQIREATQRPVNAISVDSKTIYNYLPDAIYLIYASVNHVVDIQLQAGERLTGPPVAGDTVRWIVDKTTSGSGANTTTHILVKPVQPGIETNFLIVTDRHVYRLYTRSSNNWFIPTVGWNYPQESLTQTIAWQKEQQRMDDQVVAAAPTVADLLNFKYEIDPKNEYPWTPLRVFDDGAKTFIQTNPNMKHAEAPAFFIKEGKRLNLVNYRLKGDYYIIDRLFAEGELRCGEKDRVVIRRNGPWPVKKPSAENEVPPDVRQILEGSN